MRGLFLLSLLSVVACSSGESPRSTDSRLQLDSQKAALEFINNDQVSCRGECPEAVGAFYMYSKKSSLAKTHEVRLCSVTLISENRILTNKHCIEGVLKAGDVCGIKADIEIKFPATKSKPYLTRKCRRVLSTSEDYFIAGSDPKDLKRKLQVPDWAVIELSENVTDRQAVQVSKSAVDQDNLPVALYPVFFDKQKSPPVGVIRQVKCTRVYNKGGVHIFSNDSDSPLFRIEQCSETLIPGNSGSGVLMNNSTELLGVMANTDLATGGAGTVAHCVSDFSSSQAPCIFPSEEEFTSAMKNISYLHRLRLHIGEGLHSNSQWSSLPVFQWGELGAEPEIAVRLELKEEWAKNMRYLEKKGSPQLSQRYLRAFQNLLLPRLPRCYEPQKITKKTAVPMLDLASWSQLQSYKWQEVITVAPDGTEVNTIEDSGIAATTLSIRPVAFTVTQASDGIVLDGVITDVPLPVKSLQLRVPPCH